MEVVQRIGYDSYTPDNGVLIAKNKDTRRGRNCGPNAFNSYIWAIDANPEDINMVDFVRPNGEEVMRTVADYRQLNDALFHAGLDSGSEFEWQDPHNRLHFYIIDLARNAEGILSYTLGVRSLDGSGPHDRSVALTGPSAERVEQAHTPLEFALRNTGTTAPTDPALHPQDVTAFLASDIYRIAVTVEGDGWSAQLLNALAAVEFGASQPVTVYVSRERDAAPSATVTLRATSESDPSVTATLAVEVSR
jgi:hypothetical protein